MEPFGSVRQQLWSILHFPFHLALALMMEGTNQILLCAHVVQDLFHMIALFPQGESIDGLLTTLNDTVHSVYETYPSTQDVFDEVEASLNALMNRAANTTNEEILEDAQLIFNEMVKTIIEGFGWEPPTEVADEDFTAYANSIVSIFNLTFGNSSCFFHPFSRPPVLTDILCQDTSASALVLSV